MLIECDLCGSLRECNLVEDPKTKLMIRICEPCKIRINRK